jgi:hypothetical protein
MRKIILGLTTAVAFSALAVSTVTSTAQQHTGGVAGGSRDSAGVAVKSSGGASVNANVRGTQNFAVNNNARINSNAGTWNGKRWADDDGRHHRRHDRDRFFGFVPFAAYGDYAAYDSCWQTILTPAGYQRVYICGPDGYDTY